MTVETIVIGAIAVAVIWFAWSVGWMVIATIMAALDGSARPARKPPANRK